MKRVLLSLAIAFFATTMIFAQKAQETVLKFDKQEISGYTISFSDLPVETVVAAIDEKMQKAVGKKPSSQKGYNVYINQKFSEFGTESYDIYYKVEERGKRDMKNVTIEFFVCKGNLNAISSTTDPVVSERILIFLTGLKDHSINYHTNQQIIALNNKLIKAREESKTYSEKMSKLQKDMNALELKKKELDEEIKKMEEELNSKKQ